MYSRLLGWSVENFMSIEKGSVEFDERNIINFKGYNDSGKSAMLQALKVLLTNSGSTKQVSFIQDNKEYFRVIAYFDDGVQILRDKYINGQSLYEMYKDGQVIFSTKSGRTLTRVTEVPEPIANYLGLISYDGTFLNARACFETLIGVDTSGSENYKMFNAVLKSEEIATAGVLLNNDRNKLASDISAVDSELSFVKSEYNADLTLELVEALKSEDSILDTLIGEADALESVSGIKLSLSQIQVAPQLDSVDTSQLQALSGVLSISNALSGVQISPVVPSIEVDRLTQLSQIANYQAMLDNCKDIPNVVSVDVSMLASLEIISRMFEDLTECEQSIIASDDQLSELNEELGNLQSQLADFGIKMVKCPGCGQVFNPEEAHVH